MSPENIKRANKLLEQREWTIGNAENLLRRETLDLGILEGRVSCQELKHQISVSTKELRPIVANWLKGEVASIDKELKALGVTDLSAPGLGKPQLRAAE